MITLVSLLLICMILLTKITNFSLRLCDIKNMIIFAAGHLFPIGDESPRQELLLNKTNFDGKICEMHQYIYIFFFDEKS